MSLDAALAKAWATAEAGDWAGAESLVAGLAGTGAAASELARLRGEARLMANEAEAALLLAAEAIVAEEGVDARLLKARAHLLLGEIDDALVDLRVAAALAPHDARPRAWEGLAQVQAGRVALAVVAFEAAVEADPSHRGAAWHLAAAQSRLGRPTAAGQVLEGLLRRDPDDGAAWVAWAEQAESLGEATTALGRYRAAEARVGLAASTRARMAMLEERLGEEAARVKPALPPQDGKAAMAALKARWKNP